MMMRECKKCNGPIQVEINNPFKRFGRRDLYRGFSACGKCSLLWTWRDSMYSSSLFVSVIELVKS